MKAIATLAIAGVALMFTSCGDIAFTEEMPVDSTALSEIPASCRGEFVVIEDDQNSADTFEITATQLIPGEDDPITIGEHFTIRQKGDWYYANFAEKGGWHYVLPFRPMGEDQIEYGMFLMETKEDEKTLSNIARYSLSKELFSTYQVRMNDKQFEELMKSDLLQMTRARRE